MHASCVCVCAHSSWNVLIHTRRQQQHDRHGKNRLANNKQQQTDKQSVITYGRPLLPILSWMCCGVALASFYLKCFFIHSFIIFYIHIVGFTNHHHHHHYVCWRFTTYNNKLWLRQHIRKKCVQWNNNDAYSIHTHNQCIWRVDWCNIHVSFLLAIFQPAVRIGRCRTLQLRTFFLAGAFNVSISYVKWWINCEMKKSFLIGFSWKFKYEKARAIFIQIFFFTIFYP